MGNRETATTFSLVWERPAPEVRPGASAVPPERIAAAAMEIADKEGLHAVSVKRVASRVGVPSVRMQAYLTCRDDLLDLMLDAAFGEVELLELNGARVDWRADLRALAHATEVTARRHPWLAGLAGTRTACGPNGLRNSERLLAAVARTGLDAATMTQTVNTVLSFVYGYVQIELLEPTRRSSNEVSEAGRRNHTTRYLLDVVSRGDYPTLAHIFAEASDLTPEDSFDAGLDCVLDGIAARVSAAAQR